MPSKVSRIRRFAQKWCYPLLEEFGLMRSNESEPDRPRHTVSNDKRITHHVCVLCGKARSSNFQARHPIAPGERSIPGVCSRPNCIKALQVRKLLDNQPSIEIQIHHYHKFEATPCELHRPHTSTDWPPIYTPDRQELPGDYPSESRMIRDLGGMPFANIGEIPPLVNKNSKPEYIATAAAH